MQKVHMALPGQIETVPGRALQPPVKATEWGIAHGAGEQPECGVDGVPIGGRRGGASPIHRARIDPPSTGITHPVT